MQQCMGIADNYFVLNMCTIIQITYITSVIGASYLVVRYFLFFVTWPFNGSKAGGDLALTSAFLM